MQIIKLIFITLLLALLGAAHSQQIVTTTGDYYSSVNGSLSYTIGEPVTGTLPGLSSILTQGFQQSRLNVTDITETPASNYEISVYPNPAQDHITVAVGNYQNKEFTYKLFDLQGKILEQKQFEPPQTEIPFRQYNPAVYFLRIYSFDTLTGTYKIVKQ